MIRGNSVVLDINVIISGLIVEHSAPFKIIEKLIYKSNYFHKSLVLSNELYKEVSEVLSRKKFNKYFSLEKKNILLRKLSRSSTLVEITEKIDLCRDPKDNIILETALAGNANYIVTGDKDLLVLKEFKNIKILTPKEFLEIEEF